MKTKTIKKYALFLYKTVDLSYIGERHVDENIVEVCVEFKDNGFLIGDNEWERAFYTEAAREVAKWMYSEYTHIEFLKLIRKSDNPILNINK